MKIDYELVIKTFIFFKFHFNYELSLNIILLRIIVLMRSKRFYKKKIAEILIVELQEG